MPQVKRDPRNNRPKKATSPFKMSMPDDERANLENTVVRLQTLRARGMVSLSAQPSAAKIIRLALRQLFATNTSEQLAELLETTEL